MNSTQPKRAIVIGASSGMGREVARLLARDGWTVGAAARRGDKLAELKAEHPDRITTATIDVTSEDAPAKLTELIEAIGGMELYFHASGSGHQNPGLDPAIELDTVELNAKGFTRMVDAAFGHMAGHGGGHIAVISSIAGTKGLGSAPSYSATKAFQATYIEALEQLARIRRLPITFTDIRPGFVDTALLAGPDRYPMLMRPGRVAESILRALTRRRHVRIIDWRYRVLVFFWRMIPRGLWTKLRIVTKPKKLPQNKPTAPF